MSGVHNGVEFSGFEAVVVEILGVKGCDRNFDGDDVCPSSVCDLSVMYHDSIFSHFLFSSMSVLFCFFLLLSLFVVVVVDIVFVIVIVIIVVVVIVVVVLAALLNLQASALHFCCIR